MVDMHMGDDEGAYPAQVEVDAVVDLPAGTGLHALEQPAVDQQMQRLTGDVAMAAAGDTVRGAVVEELGEHALPFFLLKHLGDLPAFARTDQAHPTRRGWQRACSPEIKTPARSSWLLDGRSCFQALFPDRRRIRRVRRQACSVAVELAADWLRRKAGAAM